MTDYTKHLATPSPRMSGPAPLPGMVPGSSGPATWPVDEWVRLDRFLILGHEGGSYYASERTMTLDAAKTIQACLLADPARTVQRIAEISQSGRAPKNDPAIFALAVCAAHSLETRRLALAVLPAVCRIGTHLFHFLRDYEALRPAGEAVGKAHGRYGRQVRRALAAWYQQKPVEAMAYELVKYRQRDGWAHRDVLRLAHPKWRVPAERALYQWVAKGYQAEHPTTPDLPALVRAAESIAVVPGSTPSEAFIGTAVNVIREHRLPWEAVAPELRREPGIWRALLPAMPYEATVRNLGAMTRNGALAPGQPDLAQVLARLRSEAQIHRARFHPIKALMALRTYASGQPLRGRGEAWTPIRDLVTALDEVFYTAFEAALDPRPAKVVIALDVSGSMASGAVAGIPDLTPRNASAALALVFMRQFPEHEVVCFSAGGTRLSRGGGYGTNGISRLPLTPGMRLDQAEAVVAGLDFGATDCALPMQWAQQHKIPADAFIVLTDSETNSHSVHPSRALQAYRTQMQRAAKLVVVGMVSNGFSIADPTDAGMLDVVGFDTHVPALIADFIAPTAPRPAGSEE